MNVKVKVLHLACALLLTFLAACGSGGGDSGRTPPGAPTLSLAFALKELRFSWAAVTDAEFYRLFENPDGVSGFAQIGTDLTTLSFNHPISVHRRANASYRLDACNSAGCTSSAVVTPGTNLTQAIGFVKSLNTGNTGASEFGVAVAVSADGNTLAVGEWGEFAGRGAVYIFTRGATGWSHQAVIRASNPAIDPDTGDGFGFSVSLSANGNTLAVGALSEDSSTTGINTLPNESSADSGAAYVFTRNATTGVWSQQAYIKASNTGAGDSFGRAVALSGDGNTLAVGAPLEDSSSVSPPNENATNAGAVYIYARNASAWSEQAFLKGSNTVAGHGLGASVALSTDGNTVAIGVMGTGLGGGGVDPEAAYVFTRSGTTWSQQALIQASNAQAGDRFGQAVTLSGDGNTLAVGAPNEDSSSTGVNSTPNELADSAGAAYVFIRTGTTWSQQSYLKASNAGGFDFFGSALALSADGTTLAVGAFGEASSTTGVNSTPNNSAGFAAGAAYVFVRNASSWAQQAYVKASNTGAGDAFGGAVALSGDGSTLAVGAEAEASNGTGIGSTPNEAAGHSGAVYLY